MQSFSKIATGALKTSYYFLAFIVSLVFVVNIPDTVNNAHAQQYQQQLDKMLLRAVKDNRSEIVDELVELGARAIYDPDWSALHYAAFRHDQELFGKLYNVAYPFSDVVLEKKKSRTKLVHAALIGGKELQRFPHKLIEFLRYLELNNVEIHHVHSELPSWVLAKQLALDPSIVDKFQVPPMSPVLPAISLSTDMRTSDWKIVQQQLKEFDLYRGNIDGVAGKQTKRALFAYFAAFRTTLEDRANEACARGIMATRAKNGDIIDSSFFQYNDVDVESIRWTGSGNKVQKENHGYHCSLKRGECQKGMQACWTSYKVFNKNSFNAALYYGFDQYGNIDGWYFGLWNERNQEIFKIKADTKGGDLTFFGPSQEEKSVDLIEWGVSNIVSE